MVRWYSLLTKWHRTEHISKRGGKERRYYFTYNEDNILAENETCMLTFMQNLNNVNEQFARAF